MKEVFVFTVVLFALFQWLQKEPQEVTRTIEKPVYVEKQVVVREPHIVEKTTEKIFVVKEDPPSYRQPISYEQPRARAYYATYEIPYQEERREPNAKKETKVNVDYVCDLKKPNFFGVENLCSEWRKDHGYAY